MNIGTGVVRKASNELMRSTRDGGAQLSLPLDTDTRNEDALRAAWMRSGLPMPYHVALRNRPLAICLSCLADAMRRKAGTSRRSANGDRAATRGST